LENREKDPKKGDPLDDVSEGRWNKSLLMQKSGRLDTHKKTGRENRKEEKREPIRSRKEIVKKIALEFSMNTESNR